MREIKFRAWDGQKMLDSQDLTQNGMYWDWLGKQDVELMQYTGLKDKNGKEIYEGDVVKRSKGVGYSSGHYPSFVDKTQEERVIIVKWNESLCGWENLMQSLDSNFFIEFEVIGNIWEV